MFFQNGSVNVSPIIWDLEFIFVIESITYLMLYRPWAESWRSFTLSFSKLHSNKSKSLVEWVWDECIRERIHPHHLDLLVMPFIVNKVLDVLYSLQQINKDAASEMEYIYITMVQEECDDFHDYICVSKVKLLIVLRLLTSLNGFWRGRERKAREIGDNSTAFRYNFFIWRDHMWY